MTWGADRFFRPGELERTLLRPLVLEVKPSLPPATAFGRLAALPYPLFLDSADPAGEHGRYSYITAQPISFLLARGQRVAVLERPEPGDDATPYRVVAKTHGDPLHVLQAQLARCSAPRDSMLPPFCGGAAGLFSYGLSRTLERLPPPQRDEFELPDFAVGLYDWVLAYDHRDESCRLVGLDGLTLPTSGRSAPVERRLHGILDRLRDGRADSSACPGPREERGPLLHRCS